MSSVPLDRRRQILDAALTCFLERGFAATTIADIRARSGATTGSIYHFFAGKGALAEALLREAVSGWGLATSPSDDEPAERAIKSSVHGLLAWGLANRDQARFLDEIRSLAQASPDLSAVRQLIETGQALSAVRYATYAAQRLVKQLPWPIAHALLLGPAYDYLRTAPSMPPYQIERVATLFAEAAWQAVRA